MRSILKSCALAAVLGGCLIANTQAHQPWVLTDAGHIEPGERATVLAYFGHRFPADEPMRADRIAELLLVAPNEEHISMDPDAENDLKTPPLDQPGVYVIGMRQARGYWSQITEGGRPQPRSELDNVLSCGYSDNSAKTVLIVGEGGPSAAGRALGHRLEIFSDADLSLLAEGHLAAFRVLFEGRPHHGPLMAFHADSGEDPYLVTETNEDGQAEILLEGPGPWLLLAHGEIDYPDPAVCDVERFYASLSFGQPSSR